jgi:hypothetical protein
VLQCRGHDIIPLEAFNFALAILTGGAKTRTKSPANAAGQNFAPFPFGGQSGGIETIMAMVVKREISKVTR